MTLRKKIFGFGLFLIVLMMAGVAINYWYSKFVISSAEITHIQQTQTIANATLNAQLDRQRFFAKDYSFWDDMAIAVSNRDIQWLNHELYGPLEIYQSDAVWIFTADKELLFQNVHEGTLPFTPKNLPEILGKAPQQEVEHFFEFIDQQLITYHVAPILYHTTLEKNGQPHGYILIAKRWNEEDYKKISSMINGSVSVSGNVTEQKNTTQTIFIPLLDTQQRVVAQLQFSFSDTSLTFLSQAFLFQIFVTAVLGSFAIFSTLFLFKRWIIKPTELIINKLESGSLLKRIDHTHHTHDEFVLLKELVDVATTQSELTQQLSLAIENATDACIITDTEAHIVYVNPAWEKLNGYSMAEVLGKNPNILHSGKTGDEVYAAMWKALSEGKTFTTESVINRRKDGTEYNAHVSLFPLRDNQKNKFYVGLAQNISDRMSVEKLKTQFISLASHQLRTPLSAIRWLSELLNHQFADGMTEEQRGIATDIFDATMEMIKLVNDLLNVSRIESGRVLIKSETFLIRDLADEVLKALQPLADKKQVALVTHCPEETQPITIDRILFREVMVNLLTNAIKYTPEHGQVTVDVTFEKESVSVRVADTGIGIPENQKSKIFSQFFRASNATKLAVSGTGLGLYLVKLILTALNGTINFVSEEGKGTTFAFSVPIKLNKDNRGEVEITPSTVSI